ncbi:penicillin-binding protein 2 [Blastococcus sp. CCUG 61487]|uniref:peptidoglycan D,D-transpeptidase FtsI family protein n=1 Tax=Blastococcus sp. CCUG 61487 TaxID=1840703 RepID=UPI0010BFE7B8|nr:penicillin-binding protein 2 [Blastococcus sp. CCUG 61487]TKJ34059.1 peptidoglycan glycosyltransferase [Blastococcus sp. CCUG 61487]
MPGTVRGPGGPRGGGRPAGPRTGPGAFTSRRAPGSRRSGGAGLTVVQRNRRNRVGLALLVTMLLVVVGRLAVVQGVDGAEYAAAASQDRLRTYPLAAIRGEVLDREGRPFAYTADASRVVADPTVVADPARTALALTTVLGKPVGELTDLLSRSSRYVVLAEKVAPEIANEIDDLGLGGVFLEDDPVRRYPAGTVGGQVVGFVGTDGAGLAGIEQTFDEVLAGTPGQRRVEVGSGGNPIPSRGIDESEPAVDGSSVTLTVDQDLQYVVEQRLQEACADGDTTRASAVVLDVRTGQVAAMGACPGYDPGRVGETPDRLGNPVVSDVFEPGSVMKAISLAAALEEGVATPDTHFLVEDRIEAGDRVVRDARDHEPIDWTVTGILAKSSNVGTIMLAREVGDEKLEHYLRAFGIGSRTGIELPGESAGILQDSADWTASRAANVPIGQGVSVTTLQMASVYQAIANGGVRIEPRIVHSVTAPDGRETPGERPEGVRVVSKATADSLAYMLEAVVGPGGTAPMGQIEGFRVAGKTGTAQRPDPETGGYTGGYVTTFVGFAPADDPQYVVAVDLERPTGGAEGGPAAPVFADIMRYALTADGVVPSGTARPEFELVHAP